jgi:multidrug resistance efflux pump
MSSAANNVVTEEPKLFEEIEEKKGRGIIKLILVVALLISGFLWWPRGNVKGEAVLQAGSFEKIGFTCSGVLRELVHENGDYVKKGDLIARFENEEIVKRYAQTGLDIERLKTKKGVLEENLKFHEKEVARQKILRENNVIGQTVFEKAELESTTTSKDITILEKELASAEKESEYLRTRVNALELRAPFDGVLLSDPSDRVGSPIKEGDFILEFANPTTYFLEFLVLEKDIHKISIGDKAQARFHAFPWKTVSGHVTRIAPRTTQEVERVFKVRHVVPIEVKLDAPIGDLRYGMRAKIVITTKGKGGAK